jgi:hypothetical protein
MVELSRQVGAAMVRRSRLLAKDLTDEPQTQRQISSAGREGPLVWGRRDEGPLEKSHEATRQVEFFLAMVWMLLTWSRLSSGSITEFARRATSTSLSGSRPSEWSTR